MEGESSSGMLLRNAQILAGGFLAFFFLSLLNSSYSTVMALIKEDLALSYTMSGALMSAYFVGYMLGQIPWGFLADRCGSRRVMVLSILGIASSTILFGFAHDLWQAVLTRFLAGLLGAGIFVPGVRLVSGWFSSEARGTALGILSIGGSVGLISASLFVPFTATQFGWRGTIMLFGFLGLLSTVVMWLTLSDQVTDESSATGVDELSDIIRSRSFWILAMIQMVRLGSYYAFIAWLPLLLREEFGLSIISAGATFSFFNFAGMMSNPLGGYVSDMIGEWQVLLVSFVVLSLATFLFMGTNLSPYLSVFAMGWFINFVRSPSFSILPKLYGVKRTGKVSGFQNTFASMGALVLPLVIGYVKDSTGSYLAGWMILSAFLLLAAILNLLLKSPLIQHRNG